MLLSLAYPKNDGLNTHGVNPTLSISLLTHSPKAMQDLDATAP